MFLLANHLVHALVQVVSKGFFRMFEQSVTFTGLTWGHRGRQIDEPLWIYCKSAHHLQGCDRILFSNRDVAVQPRVNDPLADDILDVEQVIQLLLCSQRWCHFLLGQERLGRLVIGSESRNRHQFTFGITKGSQFSAEHASRYLC